MDEEQATIDSQFLAFAKLFESKTRSGETITLWNSDYWMRQGNIIDDRKVTMTDTGIIFNKYRFYFLTLFIDQFFLIFVLLLQQSCCFVDPVIASATLLLN